MIGNLQAWTKYPLFAVICSASLKAEDDPKPIFWNAPGARSVVDLASRATYRTDGGDWAFDQFVGIDYNRTFTGTEGNWGTLFLQFYLTRSDSDHAYSFDDSDEWQFVTRITNFNYTGFGNGLFNIRAGHFEIPYGLDVSINTNGTLRNLLTGANLGLKADWGVSINGTTPKFKYEVSLTRGSGNEWHSQNDPYAIAGRIGVPDDQESFTGSPSAGLSFFYGDVLGRDGEVTNRSRVGLDASTFLGPLTVLGEVSVGEEVSDEVINGLFEINLISPMETMTAYTQVRTLNRNTDQGWDDSTSATLGFRYTPRPSLAISAQYQQFLSNFGDAPTDGLISLQGRYRF